MLVMLCLALNRQVVFSEEFRKWDTEPVQRVQQLKLVSSSLSLQHKVHFSIYCCCDVGRNTERLCGSWSPSRRLRDGWRWFDFPSVSTAARLLWRLPGPWAWWHLRWFVSHTLPTQLTCSTSLPGTAASSPAFYFTGRGKMNVSRIIVKRRPGSRSFCCITNNTRRYYLHAIWRFLTFAPIGDLRKCIWNQ